MVKVLDRNKVFNFHKWFAWHPVIVDKPGGDVKRVWLQFVQRRLTASMYHPPVWEYQ